MSNPTTPRVPPSSPLVLGSPRGGRTVHCTHTHPQPLAGAVWERADAREEGRRSAVLGEEGDPTKSPFLGLSPFLASRETRRGLSSQLHPRTGNRDSPPEKLQFLC